jgi:hypothetical protein
MSLVVIAPAGLSRVREVRLGLLSLNLIVFPIGGRLFRQDRSWSNAPASSIVFSRQSDFDAPLQGAG